ncbi:hypothetical protein TPHA_0D01090 [Tetrapisispora phaffii CBS 4417]|uniref:pyridoxal kinase n=1 Tax=Tetrapisispora phaffii (strain ATCC 24235 / CBS 4417 / NBRC 1672 / NRRL Y-8282 / UCD 70-5) TaxID=1071381 RepID=G8BSC9_TETPH|nr:hypothetical protein TPHA_0D01090 [Tetrapisispora phaffii CBS 4417]CCE62750.1 hypothetical protein TPHA_0D01090 [Tetrapisispora phaffii CBS 4417]
MKRVLATQSHVVYGYVGNKAATFPLQCLGWDVDCCNSVQFSNHTGYGIDKVFGNVTSEKALDDLLRGVFINFPNSYSAFLTGYLPNKGTVRTMGKYYKKFKIENPNSLWVMDPVMGDEGQLYVNEDVIPEYKELIFNPDKLVDVITPNQYELEILYDKKINTFEELKTAFQSLHATIPIIVVTSCYSTLFNDPNHIYTVASIKGQEPVILRVPLIESYFTGVGDLFSALLLDRLYEYKKDIIKGIRDDPRNLFEEKMNEVLNVIQNVLLITKKYAPNSLKSVIGDATKMKDMELKIIQSKNVYDIQMKDRDARKDLHIHNFIFNAL